MLKNENVCDSKQLKQVRNIAPKSYLIIHPHFCVSTTRIRRVTHVLQGHLQAVGKLTERTCVQPCPHTPQQQPTKPATCPATSARPPLLTKAFVSSHRDFLVPIRPASCPAAELSVLHFPYAVLFVRSTRTSLVSQETYKNKVPTQPQLLDSN